MYTPQQGRILVKVYFQLRPGSEANSEVRVSASFGEGWCMEILLI